MPESFPSSPKVPNHCSPGCPHWGSRVEVLGSELGWIRGARFYKSWRKCNVNASDREGLPVPSSWNLVYVFVFSARQSSVPFLTPPCHHCLASALSLLMNYICLHPGHLFSADPKPSNPVSVGDFPLSSLSLSLAQPDEDPAHCLRPTGRCSLLGSVPPKPGCPQQQDSEGHLHLVPLNSMALVQMWKINEMLFFGCSNAFSLIPVLFLNWYFVLLQFTFGCVTVLCFLSGLHCVHHFNSWGNSIYGILLLLLSK